MKRVIAKLVVFRPYEVLNYQTGIKIRAAKL